ncbi:hypothetical protein [Actinokineospora sp.]|uniref:hypothetical protein n=1 Tax=Actinokineospora sp. TaxID=1872133 RepID=UPI003D6A871F
MFVRSPTGWSSTTTQTAKLILPDPVEGDALGSAVAIQGSVIVAGAPGAREGDGAVYVFTEPPAGWAGTINQAVELTGTDPQADTSLGRSVAIDGDTIAAGSAIDRVYVYTRPAEGWLNASETARLIATDNEATLVGFAVDIADDTIVAGAPGDGSSRGAVYVFVRPADGWINAGQTAKLTVTAGVGAPAESLGWSVALGGATGDVIVAGAPFDTGADEVGAPVGGSVYVFVKPPAGWSTGLSSTARLAASGPEIGDQLGYAVTAFGDTIAAGAPGKGGTGAGYVFEQPAAGWVDTTEADAITTIVGAPQDAVGRSVSLDSDTLVVSAPGEDSAATDHGAAYVFRWTPLTPIPPEEPVVPDPTFAVTPSAVSFGAVLPLAPLVSRTVAIVNTGQVVLPVPTVTIEQSGQLGVPIAVDDYRVVRNGCADVALAPDTSCEIEIGFSPRASGQRDAVLRVDFGTETRTVALAGMGTAQTLTVNPTVCRSRCVVQISGTGFPPLKAIAVDLAALAGGRLPLSPTTDDTGTFTAAVVVFPRSTIGNAVLVAADPDVAAVSATATLLVAPGSLRAPDFVSRR